MALEDEGIRAVVILHDDLAAWMGRGDPEAWQRFEQALAPDFVQITPAGALRRRAEVIEGVHGVGASYGAGFAIEIADATARLLGDAVAVTYREVQSGSPRAAPDRLATALLVAERGGLLWRHLHETWCA